MNPEMNDQNSSPQHSTRNLVTVVLVLIILVGAFYFKNRKIAELSVYDTIKSYQELAQAKDYEGCVVKAQAAINKDSKDLTAWQWLGNCQFEAEKYDESKATFEQVLTLNPQDQSAKNHLELIGYFLNKNVTIIDSENIIDRGFVETALGFSLSSDYKFTDAVRLSEPKSGTYELQFTANFVADGSFSEVKEEIEDLLTEKNILFVIDSASSDQLTLYSVRTSDINEPFRGYSVSVFNQKPVVISIFYEK